jgi:hypothetical protein
VAGNEGGVHEHRFPERWRSDRVYVHEVPRTVPVLNIGTAYRGARVGPIALTPISARTGPGARQSVTGCDLGWRASLPAASRRSADRARPGAV